jgi:hypothetical protein
MQINEHAGGPPDYDMGFLATAYGFTNAIYVQEMFVLKQPRIIWLVMSSFNTLSYRA